MADSLPGPVFVHTAVCTRYDAAQWPAWLSEHALTLTAYGKARRVVAETKIAAKHSPETSISELLDHSEVEYIHIRDTEAGCYDCRIERA
ncbi:MAG: hypothetical protein NVS9B15_01990 [Acidobacteriaceae bacterium]